MPSRSKQKGNGYEREIIAELAKVGIDSKRAWGSNGAAIGESEGVDVVFEIDDMKWRVQAKRRAKLAEYMKPPEGSDVVMMREDRGGTLVVLPLHLFLSLLK
jgi:Holliday junction resolvase